MAEPTSDWLKRTGRVGKNFRKFLKFSGPVSSLVAAGLDTVFQPESDEYIAISKLNVDMNKGFEMVSESLQSVGNRVFHRMNMINYQNNVVFTMMHLQEIANIATKPSPEAYVKQQLKEICIAYNGPILTLMRIKVMTVDNCEWPSSENEKLLNRAIDLFSRLDAFIPNEKKFGSFLANYNSRKQEFMNKLNSEIQLYDLETRINELIKENNNEITVITMQIEETLNKGGRREAPEDCLLESALRSYEFKSVALESIVNRIISDVMQLGKLATICANVASNGDESKIKEYLDRILEISERILNYAEMWSWRRLDIQFPETQIKYAKMAIGNETFAVNTYNTTAEIFGIELAERGLNMRHYTVIITNKKDDYTTYSGPRCTRESKCYVLIHSNIKITTIRQVVRPESAAIYGQNFTTEWETRIVDIIKQSRKTANLTVIANDIESEVELTIDRGFHNYLFLRDEAYFGMFCYINFGIYSQETGIIKSYSLIDYYFDEDWGDAQQFYLFLIL